MSFLKDSVEELDKIPQEDTMGVIGADGKKHHLYRTRAEEDAAVERSPLAVALAIYELAEKVGAFLYKDQHDESLDTSPTEVR